MQPLPVHRVPTKRIPIKGGRQEPKAIQDAPPLAYRVRLCRAILANERIEISIVTEDGEV
jgi:hypothetical protein